MENNHYKATSKCDNNTLIGPNILLDNEDGFLRDIRQEGAGLEIFPVECYFVGSIAKSCSSLEQL